MPDVSSGGLPRPLTSFIGRERELAQARRLLAGSCLVTLTGPGGSGKTRLGIALAAEVADDYPDGVFFVPLAPIRDPDLVPSTIAQSLGLQDARDRPLMDHLVSQLRDRQMLLVLDNFEHLLAGVPAVARLLRETSALRILASSRSPLRVSGEQECPVPPLAVPDPGTRPTPGALAACESVRLFAERAAAVAPDFTLDQQNAAAIAQIARRLDGLPLAIELAAARVKLLSPEAILARLEHSLRLLTGGGRAAMAAELGLTQLTGRARQMLGYSLLDRGELAAARAALAEGVPVSMEIGDRWIVQIGLGGFIGLAVKTGRPRLALRLAGAADAFRAANEFSMPAPMQEIVERWLGPARARAGSAAGRLAAEGRRLSPEEAIRLALANEPDDAAPPGHQGSRPTLTRRETEVAALAAHGLTNRDIAAQLFLSVRTVETHVDHILTKLGFRTRTQLAAWAHEEGLLTEDT
jgi:DNA-binding CsgD family transcriptional regulator